MSGLRVVVPKGSIQEKVLELMCDMGIELHFNERDYRPRSSDQDIQIKVMRPQNIPKLIEIGSHDVGFTGHDWVVEAKADVVELLDLGFDPVKIVAAVPEGAKGMAFKDRRIVVASEYENISEDWLRKEGYDFVLLRTYGATEAFPPDDADMIIDNMASGRTLAEHGLAVIATVMESSTRMIANRKALQDPWKRAKMDEMLTMVRSVIDAKGRVMLEMNVPKEAFDAIIKVLPCMRSPTVAQLHGGEGYAVKVAVKKVEVPKLIPRLKKMGATDILEYDIRKVVV